ncbi:MAG: CBS domain-containing protein [Candidatus Kuenenia sp.]|nr:CBS domain-containing protein [Candidatus Kuenenia hertensis]
MGFQVIDQGIRVPATPGTFTTPPRKVERLQHITKDKKVERHEEDLQEREQKEKQKPQTSRKQIYQKTEYTHQKNSILANQIMSSPLLTILPDTTLNEAWEIIRERRFRHLPILSSDKKLVGIVSDRDLLREAAHIEISREKQSANSFVKKTFETEIKPYNGGSYTEGVKESQKKKTVQDICRTRVLTATPDTNIREIAKILIEEHIGSMPIVDENGTLLGMITRSDVLRTIVTYGALDLLI